MTIRYFSLFVFGTLFTLAVLFAGALPAHALSYHGGGMYVASCTNIALEGAVLKAKCKDMDGNPIEASLYLNYFITNNDGTLQSNPEGNFSKTCENIALSSDGIMLSASCKNRAGEPQAAHININEHVTNDDGTLRWEF